MFHVFAMVDSADLCDASVYNAQHECKAGFISEHE